MVTNTTPLEPGLDSLVQGIVMQGVSDLFCCLVFDRMLFGVGYYVSIEECENFFRSPWFAEICGIDGESIIRETRQAAMRARAAQYFVRRIGKKYQVFNKNTQEVVDTLPLMEESHAKAAKLNNLTVWQFNMLTASKPRPNKRWTITT